MSLAPKAGPISSSSLRTVRAVLDDAWMSAGNEATDQHIDSMLANISMCRPHLMHKHLQTKLNTYSPKQLKMSDALHTALGQWLDTPRTLGELNTLLFVFNEGLLFCVEDGNDCEAEHFCMEEADVQALELAMQPHESNEALSLKSFEEELMRLGEDDA